MGSGDGALQFKNRLSDLWPIRMRPGGLFAMERKARRNKARLHRYLSIELKSTGCGY